MGSVRVKRDKLFIDFRFLGERCREYTALPDTKPNRKLLQQLLSRVESEISLGTFNYLATFPGSKTGIRLAQLPSDTPDVGLSPIPAALESVDGGVMRAGVARVSTAAMTPLFKDFAEVWVVECGLDWRASHRATVRSTLDRHLIPAFGDVEVGSINKSDVLQLRTRLAQLSGRNGNASLSAKTINRVIQVLGQILEEAADRFGITNPVKKVKRLRQPRVDIHPFSMSEVQLLINTVRPDYRSYLVVRFFTGMRTGELHGLRWSRVDFERRQILVRDAWVRGKLDETKTDGSIRDIEMSQPVFDALMAQRETTYRPDGDSFVFCNRMGEPFDVDNITNRLWYPLLRHLGLARRRPYQTRHTFATLLLGAGENPEFVARQLGHANTMMLFNTYSRYVPNLTRRDGSAFNRMVTGALLPPLPSEATGLSMSSDRVTTDQEVGHAA